MAERQQHKSYRPQVVKRWRSSYLGPSSGSSSNSNSNSAELRSSRHCAAAPDNRKPYQDAGDAGGGGDYDDDDNGPPLPAHAHHHILDRLPVRQRCQMRLLCKAWNDSLQSTSEEVWFVMVRPPKYGPGHRRVRDCRPKYGHLEWRFRAYSSCSLHSNMKEGKSELGKPFFRPPLPNPHHSTLSTILGGRNCSRVGRRLDHTDKDIFFLDLLLCSAGGLITAIVHMPDAETSYGVILFNCLTGSVKVLPPPTDPETLTRQGALNVFPSMTLDWKDPSCYYILLNPSFSGPYIFEFYESRSQRWKTAGIPDLPFESGMSLRNFVLTHPSSDELSVVDGDFWWLQSSFDYCHHCLLAYHVRQDAWTSLLVPKITCDIEITLPTSVVRFRGRLRVGVLLLGLDRVILGFGVWELQLATSTWVEVARTPKHLVGPPLVFGTWYCNLSADGDLFWMTVSTKRSFRPPLVFDMARNAWYSLPLEKTTRKFGCILLCRPSFRASV